MARSSAGAARQPKWMWNCYLPEGWPTLGGDSGTSTDLDDCKAKFKTAWTRIRASLTDADIAKARDCSLAVLAHGHRRPRHGSVSG
jgi:hypothetical protein